MNKIGQHSSDRAQETKMVEGKAFVYDKLNDEWVSWDYFDKLIKLRKKHKKWYKNNIAKEESLKELTRLKSHNGEFNAKDTGGTFFADETKYGTK